MHETPYRRESGYAERYRDQRFATGHGPATDRRERSALRSLLASARWPDGPWLDVPCGAGRLTGLLPGRAVQADRDPAMVRACPDNGWRLCASAHRLPFADGAFAGVLCHRLLQHIPTAAERRQILGELRRVSRGVVLVSFFDRHSLQHLRRVVRRALGKPRSGRTAVGRRQFAAELRDSGLDPLRFVALRRFVAEQTLVLCTVR